MNSDFSEEIAMGQCQYVERTSNPQKYQSEQRFHFNDWSTIPVTDDCSVVSADTFI